MIDSICLSIPCSEVKDIEPNAQSITAWELHSKTKRYTKYVKNVSVNKSGTYYPHLTRYTKWFNQEANVRIEFSVPKLFFQNNLDELEDADFLNVITVLQKRLHEMDVSISKEALVNSVVSGVHFSKNIVLENGYTTSYLISEMNKINLRKVFDFTRAKYTNDGQSLYAHTASHELIIYDKVADILASEKRAMDRGQSAYQRSIFAGVEKKNLPEVIRFEVRLVRKPKMNSVLGKVGHSKNPTFKDVFNSQLSRKVILLYWQEIIKAGGSVAFSIPLSSKDMLRAIFMANKDMKAKQGIYLAGLSIIARDGIRELRSIVSKQSGERTWYRISKDIALVNSLITQNRVRDWVRQIDHKLANYKTYRTGRLSTLPICNVKKSKVSSLI
ncbi:MAG: hypothetical protein WCT44_03550 [Candidatus Paceibacterota bacterium]